MYNVRRACLILVPADSFVFLCLVQHSEVQSFFVYQLQIRLNLNPFSFCNCKDWNGCKAICIFSLQSRSVLLSVTASDLAHSLKRFHMLAISLVEMHSVSMHL